MAEKQESRPMWQRKRYRAESIARARAAKAAKRISDGDVEGSQPGPSTSVDPELREPPSVDPEAGASRSVDPTPRVASSENQGDDESSGKDSESENERGDSSSEEEGEFGEEQAQELFDDFMVSLPLLQRKTLAVLLMHSFRVRQKLSVTGAALEAASITGFNERTVRKYKKQFYENRGKFPESRQGKFERHCLFNDENLRLQAAMWVRENSYQKGEANMTARSFCQWVNDHLLPTQDLPPELPRSISVRTATRWLRRLGFRPKSHKKGAYVDGHEREDVVVSRREYLEDLKKLKEQHRPPPPCSDERAATPPPNAEEMKQLVLIYHDESIFNTNDSQLWMWAADDMVVLRPKTRGSGIMVSDFIDQHSGFLQLSEEERAHVERVDPNFPVEARALLEYGAEREGYWTSEKFMKNIEDAARIAEYKYPAEKYSIAWLFDHSSCHRAFADDALNAKKMNVRPGGKQPKMRDTIWAGRPQSLVDEDGVPKGMKQVLRERGINTERMVADDMRVVLSMHDDFRKEQTIVEQFLTAQGHQVFFIPKFHCELNPIERVWGQAKVYSRKHTNFTLPRLRLIIRPALDSVSLDLIRKYFRKAQDYERAYSEGKESGKELEQAVKVCKSHRRIFFES